jgi:hypothetical protein
LVSLPNQFSVRHDRRVNKTYVAVLIAVAVAVLIWNNLPQFMEIGSALQRIGQTVAQFSQSMFVATQ